METIYFTKFFTKGVLKGLHYIDHISFPTVEGCLKYIQSIERKGAAGNLPYKIVDKSFQNYSRA